MNYEILAKDLMAGKTPPGLESDGSQVAIKGYRALLRWAVANIGAKPDDLLPSQLPNESCREFLRWAQTSKDKFWQKVEEYDLRDEEDQVEQKKFEDDQRKNFKLLDKIHAHWKQQLAAQSSNPTPSA